jgi:hypothetical protein
MVWKLAVITVAWHTTLESTVSIPSI